MTTAARRLPRSARLLRLGLAAVVLGAPLAVAVPASAAVSPADSCAAVAAADPTAVDGDQLITVQGQTLTVWCADMATVPVEYLTLPQTGAGSNFSEVAADAWNYPGSTVLTRYTRVRLNLPAVNGAPFTVTTTDHRFSTSTGSVSPGWTEQHFGTANACGSLNGGENADGNVDLRGTAFGVDAASFAVQGFIPSGAVTQVSTQEVTFWVNGWCGSVDPVAPLPLIWLGAVAPVVTDPVDATVTSGQDAVFTASATGDPLITVQWQTSRDGSSWLDVAGATGTELTLAGTTLAQDGLLVRAVFTNPEGSQPTAAATLTVEGRPATVVDGPEDATVDSGQDAVFTVVVDGDEAPSIHWVTSTDGTTWTAAGSETDTLVVADATTALDGRLYRAEVENSTGAVDSDAVMLTVRPLAPQLTTAPQAVTVDAGRDAVFTAAVTGDPAPSLQWQTSVDNVVWTDVAGATTGTLTLPGVTAAQNGLWVRVHSANAGGATASQGVRLTVVSPAVVTPAAPAPAGRPALAVTGADALGLLAAAGTLLLVGAGAVVVARRRASAP